MMIGVVGLGYVGLVTAVVLASQGNKVVGIDTSDDKISSLNSGQLLFYEPGLKERFEEAKSMLKFSGDYSLLSRCKAIFICVPTPNKESGIDLSYVVTASQRIKTYAKDAALIIKSTVIPGTAKMIQDLTGMNVISNPEFTREGSALVDTEHPDRIIIGGQNVQICKDIWEFTSSVFVVTSNENAEMIKYASNAFLATKISFINQIADLCENIPNTDVEVIAKGIGLDHRIGKEFLKAGLGYGGSCFPKDTEALTSYSKSMRVDLSLINAVINYNSERIDRLVNKILSFTGSLENKNVCILGLSFKENTDDLRESRSLALIKKLSDYGPNIRVYDPIVKQFQGLKMCKNINECISDCDIIITATEWTDFKKISSSQLEGKLVFDLRRILDVDKNQITMGVGIGKN